MNRATKYLAFATSVVVLGVGSLALPAAALGSGPRGTTGAAAPCRAVSVKPVVHDDAVRREATLTALAARLRARKDPFGLNAPQIDALEAAKTAISALDGQIATTCYPSFDALKTDAKKLFVDYRVYWLRGPQTHVIEAADRLAEARTRLGKASAKLGALVGSNAAAATDLAAMNQDLANADSKLGTPPTAGPSIAAVVALLPAADMTHDSAVLQGARGDLVAVRAALAQARADGLKVVNDLQH